MLHHIERELVAGAEFLRGIHQQQQQITTFQRGPDFLHHLAVERRVRFMNAGGIHEDDLPGGPAFPGGHVDHTQDAVTRGLRFVGDDRNFFAYQRVQQRRLARVRAAKDADETGAKCHAAQALNFSGCEVGCELMRSRSMRRSVDCRISKRKPSCSTISP